MNFMRYLDKLICLLVSMPPLYMLYRFVRWYVRTDSESKDESVDADALG